jgi:hypothetical protein
MNSLGEKEIRDILNKSNSKKFALYADEDISGIEWLREQMSNSSELDILFSFQKKGITVSNDFTRERYITRIFGQEFIKRGLHLPH